jgi:glycosyltransferase involved in cell wall biosynthesis
VAIRSALGQTFALEVLVIDDGSTDGTAEMIRREFPTVRLERSERSQGYICQRNRAAQLALGEVIFSMDDDAEFSTANVVEQTLKDFDHPHVGAVAIPYIEPRKSSIVRQQAPSANTVFVTSSFIGTAHAVRKDLFLQLGGYREALIHQGEEMDFCIRMLAAGHVVRLGRADVIRHFESPRRDFQRRDFYGPRNSVLFAWQNAPWPYLPFHLLATTVNCLKWTSDPRRLKIRACGILCGYWECLKQPRAPVPSSIYRLWRRLIKLVSVRIEECNA